MKGEKKCVRCGKWAYDLSPKQDTKGMVFVCYDCDQEDERK